MEGQKMPFGSYVARHENTILEAISRGTYMHGDEETQENYQVGLDVFIESFATILLQIIEEGPTSFGIDLHWTDAQVYALKSAYSSVKRGYLCPAFQLPTGIGKTHVTGAISFAFLTAGFINGLIPQVVLLTSRINLAEQAMLKEVLKEESLEEEVLADEAINEGDFSAWVNRPNFGGYKILAGSYWAREKKNGQKFTSSIITTYQGLLKSKNILDYKQDGVLRLVICDECHNVTDDCAKAVEEHFPGLYWQFSATVQGPMKRNVFKLADPIANHLFKDITPNAYNSALLFACNLSISEQVRQGGAPPVRIVQVAPRYFLDNRYVISGNKFSGILNEHKIAQTVFHDLKKIVEFLKSIFIEGEHLQNLVLLGGARPHERQGIAFCYTVDICRDLTTLFNEVISPLIKEKFGVTYTAGYVAGSGRQKKEDYKKTMTQFKKKEINFLFSCKMIGEGVDLPEASMGIFLKTYGVGQSWLLTQEFGRLMRMFYEIVNFNLRAKDTLIFEGLFTSSDGKVTTASILGLSGVKEYFPGQIVIGNEQAMAYEDMFLRKVRAKMSIDKAIASLREGDRKENNEREQGLSPEGKRVLSQFKNGQLPLQQPSLKYQGDSAVYQNIVHDPKFLVSFVISLLIRTKKYYAVLCNLDKTQRTDFLQSKLLTFNRVSIAFSMILGREVKTQEDFMTVLAILRSSGLTDQETSKEFIPTSNILGVKDKMPTTNSTEVLLDFLNNNLCVSLQQVIHDNSWMHGGYYIADLSVKTLDGVVLYSMPFYGTTEEIARAWAVEQLWFNVQKVKDKLLTLAKVREFVLTQCIPDFLSFHLFGLEEGVLKHNRSQWDLSDGTVYWQLKNLWHNHGYQSLQGFDHEFEVIEFEEEIFYIDEMTELKIFAVKGVVQLPNSVVFGISNPVFGLNSNQAILRYLLNHNNEY